MKTQSLFVYSLAVIVTLSATANAEPRKKLKKFKSRTSAEIAEPGEKGRIRLFARFTDEEMAIIEAKRRKEAAEQRRKAEAEKRAAAQRRYDAALSKLYQNASSQNRKKLRMYQGLIQESHESKHKLELKAIKVDQETDHVRMQVEAKERELQTLRSLAKSLGSTDREASDLDYQLHRHLLKDNQQQAARVKQLEADLQVSKEVQRREHSAQRKELEAELQAIKEVHRQKLKAQEVAIAEKTEVDQMREQRDKLLSTVEELLLEKAETREENKNDAPPPNLELDNLVKSSQDAAEQLRKEQAELKRILDEVIKEKAALQTAREKAREMPKETEESSVKEEPAQPAQKETPPPAETSSPEASPVSQPLFSGAVQKLRDILSAGSRPLRMPALPYAR